MDREENRNSRRDKKLDKRRNGMRVDDAAKKLAEILRDRRLREQQTRNMTNRSWK